MYLRPLISTVRPQAAISRQGQAPPRGAGALRSQHAFIDLILAVKGQSKVHGMQNSGALASCLSDKASSSEQSLLLNRQLSVRQVPDSTFEIFRMLARPHNFAATRRIDRLHSPHSL